MRLVILMHISNDLNPGDVELQVRLDEAPI